MAKKTVIENYVDTIKETLSSILEQVAIKDNQIEELKSDLKEAKDELEFSCKEHFGLDTIRYELENGNLAIEQELEAFFTSLKKKYGMIAS